jgi:hypothetical protein
MFRRHCVDDIANDRLGPLDWKQFAGASVYNSTDNDELAVAMPTVPRVDHEMLALAFDRLAQWDCQLNAELWDCQSAYLMGRQIGSMASHLRSKAISQLGDMLSDWSYNLPKSTAAQAPLYVLYQTSGGDPMFVPMPIARDWQMDSVCEDLIEPISVDEGTAKLAEVMDMVNARLKWAGGRMSIAINYIQDWVADRVAQTPTADIR